MGQGDQGSRFFRIENWTLGWEEGYDKHVIMDEMRSQTSNTLILIFLPETFHDQALETPKIRSPL